MSEDAPETTAKIAAARCPICGKPADARYKPFCSRRCADIDLGRWLKGGYAIPARQEPEEEMRRPMPTTGGGRADSAGPGPAAEHAGILQPRQLQQQPWAKRGGPSRGRRRFHQGPSGARCCVAHPRRPTVRQKCCVQVQQQAPSPR